MSKCEKCQRCVSVIFQRKFDGIFSQVWMYTVNLAVIFFFIFKFGRILPRGKPLLLFLQICFFFLYYRALFFLYSCLFVYLYIFLYY